MKIKNRGRFIDRQRKKKNKNKVCGEASQNFGIQVRTTS